MTRARQPIPPLIYPTLWSYDPRGIDVRMHAETIITQVLNYGDWGMVRWLLHVYDTATIRAVVSHPRRGVWFPQALNLWTKMFKVRLPRWLRQMAVRDLDHAPWHPQALRRYRRWQTRFRSDGSRREI